MNALQTINVEYMYPDGTPALQGIDLKIEKGKKTAILGPNGAGKSTLLYLLNGTFRPSGGTLLLFGAPMEYDTRSLRGIRSTVGMVFQNPDDQLFAPTVEQDVSFGPLNLKLPKEEVKRRVEGSLMLVGMTGFETIPPHHLSAGQKKRVAIAGVLAMEPDIFVLDEPLSGLDPRGQSDMIEILEQLNAEGRTIIIATHRMDFAASWADRICVLDQGKLISHGPPEEIFSDMAMINKIGLDAPVIVKTQNELRSRGFDRKLIPLSMLELVEALTPVRSNVWNIHTFATATDDFSPGADCYIQSENGILKAVKHHSVHSFIRFICTGAWKKNDLIPIDLSAIQGGTVWILRVPSAAEGGADEISVDLVRSLIESKDAHLIAAMGTVAKTIAKNAGLTVDIRTDVVQCSISACLRGFSIIILATGKMAQLAAQKIENMNARMDRKVRVQVLDDLENKNKQNMIKYKS